MHKESNINNNSTFPINFFSSSLIIFLLSFVAYLAAYAYETGYASVYGIPNNYISVGFAEIYGAVKNIFVFTISLLVCILIIDVFVGIKRFHSYILVLSFFVFIWFAVWYKLIILFVDKIDIESVNQNFHYIEYSYVGLLLCIAIALFVYIDKVDSNLDRLSNSLYLLLKQKITQKNVIVKSNNQSKFTIWMLDNHIIMRGAVMLLMILGVDFLSYSIGQYYAEKQSKYQFLERRGADSKILLKKYDDYHIVASIENNYSKLQILSSSKIEKYKVSEQEIDDKTRRILIKRYAET